MMTGVILAGGQNRRMEGKLKALLPFGGESILERQIRRMKKICRELIIVANQPERFQLFSRDDAIRVVTDDIPGKGPLAGIHAAASRAENEHLWVVACDMPYISPEAAEILLEKQKAFGCDAAVPVIEGITQPLHGIYSQNIAPKLRDVLQNKEYKVRALLDRIEWVPVHEDLFRSKKVDLRFAMNLNTPHEYQQALDMRK